jgi:shikimate kinase
MKLVFLYGMPASGKLTVAQQIARTLAILPANDAAPQARPHPEH